MKKVLFSAALLMAAATVSFAGNPKGETITTENPSVTKSEAKDNFTYYVVARNQADGTYELSETPPIGGCPNLGPDPCQITTSVEHTDLIIDQEGVDTQTEATINSRRTL